MTTPLAPTPVDIRAIERELTALWQDAAERAEAGRGATVTRALLVNLVVVVRGREAAEDATRVIDRLTGVCPNRAIVATTLDEPQDQPIAAWVQAHCQLPAPGRPQVCGEQITIEARADAADRVPGVVLPLLAPDVPVAIWLPSGHPAEHPALARLADVADRLIFDSATFDGRERGLAALTGLLDADTGVSDLAWGRLTPWRELVAQFFDAPAMRVHLAEIERVRVTVPVAADGTGDRGQALLLLGWLASQLGWQLGERGGRMLRSDGGAALVEVVPVAGPAPADDRVAALAIAARRAQFVVARASGADTVVTRARAAGAWPIQRTVRIERLDDAALLAGELQVLGRDQSFESALRVAAALAGRI